MNRFVVMFDASPGSEPTPWMAQTAAQAELFLVHPNDIARLVSEDEEARTALSRLEGRLPDPSLSRFFQAALDKHTQGKTRIALSNLSWIVYGLTPDAVVYAFDQVDNAQEREKAGKAGLAAAQYAQHVEFIKKQVREVMAKVPPDRTLEVKGTDAQKVSSATAFIRSKQPR